MNPRFNLSRVAAATATITLVAAPAWAADLTMTAPPGGSVIINSPVGGAGGTLLGVRPDGGVAVPKLPATTGSQVGVVCYDATGLLVTCPATYGAQGPAGPKGDTGAEGPAGPAGPKGDIGAAGVALLDVGDHAVDRVRLPVGEDVLALTRAVQGDGRARFEDAALVVPAVPLPERLRARRAAVPLGDVLQAGFDLCARVGRLAGADTAPRRVQELEQAVSRRGGVLRGRVPRRLLAHQPVSRTADTERLQNEYPEQFKTVTRCMKKIEKKFSIIIPDNEIAIILEIIGFGIREG